MIDEETLQRWPNCITPDCDRKRCLWSMTPYCYPCAERQIGKSELEKRYAATHDPKTDERTR